MSTVKCSIDAMESTISEMLQGWADDIAEAVAEDAKAVAKEGVSKLKSESPVGSSSKHYKTGWTSTTQTERSGEVEIVIHNTKKPGLTHLLENGHVLYIKGRQHGHVGPVIHIEPVESYVMDEFQKKVEADIERLS